MEDEPEEELKTPVGTTKTAAGGSEPQPQLQPQVASPTTGAGAGTGRDAAPGATAAVFVEEDSGEDEVGEEEKPVATKFIEEPESVP